MSEKTICQATELGAKADGCTDPVVGCVALLKFPDERLYVCRAHADELHAQLGDTIQFTEIETKDVDAEKELDGYRKRHNNMRIWLFKALKDPGWGVVEGPDPNDGHSSLYTCGAWISTLHPELISFSLPPHDISRYLNRLVDTALHAKTFGQYQTYAAGQDIVEPWRDGPPRFRTVEVEQQYRRSHLPLTCEVYGHDEFPALQLVWSDPAGKYPWERGFDKEFWGDQPILGPHKKPRARRARKAV